MSSLHYRSSRGTALPSPDSDQTSDSDRSTAPAPAPRRAHPVWGDEDLDTDSPTSSDEEESLSSSSSSRQGDEAVKVDDQIGLFDAQAKLDDIESGSDDESDDTIWRSDEPDRTPRRIIRRKAQIQEAFECLIAILIKYHGEQGHIVVSRTNLDVKPKPPKLGREAASTSRRETSSSGLQQRSKRQGSNRTDGDCSQRWSRLVRLLNSLRDDGDAARDPTNIRNCLGVLQWLLGRVSPLTSDKQYISTLSGLERRVVRSIGSTILLLPQGSDIPTEDALSPIFHVPLSVLVRLTSFTLAHSPRRPVYLDLSQLTHLSLARLRLLFEQDGVPACLRILGSSPSDVTHLNLSNNGLTDLDEIAIWHNQPFPNLQVIDLSLNPDLTSIPLSLCRLPKLRRFKRKGTPISVRDCGQSQARYRATRARSHEGSKIIPTLPNVGHASLADLCITVLVREGHAVYPSERAEWTREITNGLPSVLGKVVGRSFICDRCLCICIAPRTPIGREDSDTSQLPVQVSVGWEIERWDGREHKTQSIKVEGTCCMRCLAEVNLTKGRV